MTSALLLSLYEYLQAKFNTLLKPFLILRYFRYILALKNIHKTSLVPLYFCCNNYWLNIICGVLCFTFSRVASSKLGSFWCFKSEVLNPQIMGHYQPWAIRNWATEMAGTPTSLLAQAMMGKHMHTRSICMSGGRMCPRLVRMELGACACHSCGLSPSLPPCQSSKAEKLGNSILSNNSKHHLLLAV